MLMFSNSLLSTFIPEILMVLGYLFCFIAPTLKAENETIESHNSIVFIQENQDFTANSYVVKTADFQTNNIVTTDFVYKIEFQTLLIEFKIPDSIFFISSAVSFKLFSRPPPAHFC